MCPSYQRPLPPWALTHPNIKGSSTNQTRPRRQTSAMANKRTSHRATVLWEVRNLIAYSSPSLPFTQTTLSLPYLTALMVMLVSGMHIGWGICCPQIRYQEWHLNTYPHEYIMVILSWFLGAIIGSIMTLYVYTRFTKREIYVSTYLHYLLCPCSNRHFYSHCSTFLAHFVYLAVAYLWDCPTMRPC